MHPRLIHLLQIVMLATFVCMCGGCAGMFESSCTKVVPILAQGNSIVNDAQDALLQAEAMAEVVRDVAIRTKALDAIEEARKQLRIAEGVLHAATQACTAPDLPAIFKAFAQAWELVRPILGTMGGAGGAIKDPMAYSIGKQG